MSDFTSGEVVSARGLRKVYNGTVAIHKLDLAVPAGQFLGCMGPSGSGKTTLLHLLGGLETPTEGTVQVAGTRIDLLSEDEAAVFRRRNIGVVYQFFNLVPHLTVAENIAIPLLLEGRRLFQVEDRIRELTDFFGISDHLDRFATQLSGGEMQRVGLARAMIAEPSLILADEPTGNLDTKSGEAVLKFIRRMVDERGVTAVLVTHDLKATGFVDRVIKLEDGRIIDDIGAGSSGVEN